MIIPGEFSINIIQRDFGAVCAMTLQSDLPSWTFANPLGDTFSAGGMDTDTRRLL